MKLKPIMGGFLIIFFFLNFSFALEPKVLWKKEMPSKIHNVSFAGGSGDVIFIHEERKNRITLIDKEGNTCWQWGPSLEEIAVPPVGISKDGEYFVYSSALDENVSVYYCERNGKEIWEYEGDYSPVISPNGKYIFIANPPTMGGHSILLDSNKKILWKGDLGEVYEQIFTPDNNFIIYSTISGPCRRIYLFNINNNSLSQNSNSFNIYNLEDANLPFS